MKKMLLLTMVFLLALSAVSCKSPSEAIGEAVGEKIVESIGDGVDVDIDSGEVTIEGKEGQKVTFGATEWPDTDIAKTVPRFKKGIISSVISADNGFMIAIDEVEKEDYESYLKDIKKEFSHEAMESRMDGIHSYAAENDKGEFIMMGYDTEMKALDISVEKMSE